MKKYFLPLFGVLISFFSSAQSLSILDSTAAEALLIGGVTTNILDKDDLEVSLNNSFTTFWFVINEFNDEFFQRITDRRRITSFNQTMRVSYGFSPSRRFDLGLEVRYNHYRDDDAARSTPLRVFQNNHPENGTSYRGLANAGLRLRYRPLDSDPAWIIQAAFAVPVSNTAGLERSLLNADVNQAELTSTYYRLLGNNTYYFLQGSVIGQFSPQRRNLIGGPSFYLIKSVWNNVIFVYPGLSYSIASQTQSNGGFQSTSHYVFGGLGMQYQPVRSFNIGLTYQYPLLIENGSIFAGIERSSFSNASLSLRWMMR